MISLKQRLIKKNEATGIRVVSQYVQEFWECGWQPFDQRNDEGIDGLILLKKRGVDLGVSLNVQVKCGDGYISSHDKKYIKIKFPSEDNLNRHITYWKKQKNPAVLVFVNPGERLQDNSDKEIDTSIINDRKTRLNPQAWWVDLKSLNLKSEKSKTIIQIPKNQKFSEHSKGDFIKLCSLEHNIIEYPDISLNKESLELSLLKNNQRDFYKNWVKECDGKMFCQAINDYVIISNTGWKHITSSKRGFERIQISKKYLGAAKQIINEVNQFYNFKNEKKPFDDYDEYKIGLFANIRTKEQNIGIMNVVLNVREYYADNSKKYWFYSVHIKKKSR